MKPGSIRIIGGKWRGRKLQVPDITDLRPTPDRVRETLFNWLAPVLPGSYCLDVFAGSGALGFEALSRGAASVTMVDYSPNVITLLQKEADHFKTEAVNIYRAKAPSQLREPKHLFDIVFIDPPYQSHLLLPCCEYLETHAFLAHQAYIYLEADRIIEDNDLPPAWRLIKKQRAGQVFYHLAYRELKNNEQRATKTPPTDR